jgi:hypothetical protein
MEAINRRVRRQNPKLDERRGANIVGNSGERDKPA